MKNVNLIQQTIKQYVDNMAETIQQLAGEEKALLTFLNNLENQGYSAQQVKTWLKQSA